MGRGLVESSVRRKKMQACGACRVALYASRAEQREDWPRHRLVCPHLAAVRRYTKQEMLASFRPPTDERRVAKVSDGDTLRVAPSKQDGKQSDSVRFDGVDTPEIHHAQFEVPRKWALSGQPLGDVASLFIKTLARQGAPTLLAHKPGEREDKYGRLVADVWVRLASDSSWVWLQEALLAAGLAHRYADYDKRAYASGGSEKARVLHLDALAQEARAARRGVWCQSHEPMTPAAWRRAAPRERGRELARYHPCSD